jgi:hypothetical protein
MRFLSSGFIHQSTPFGPLLTLLNFLKFCLEITELFEFKLCPALWAIAVYQIFFADTRDLKL